MGLIVDVQLPDGSGLGFLRGARGKPPDVPALILTGLHDNHLASASFELRATYLVKPVEDVYVASLVQHVLEPIAVETRVNRVVRRWTARYGLSDAEAAILLLATEGYNREAIGLIRSSCASTTKTQIHNLIQKTRDACLWEAVNRVLREALDS
jgi:DNA-binding NarL/FixJ family response regulator